jgi:hypothetical protein
MLEKLHKEKLNRHAWEKENPFDPLSNSNELQANYSSLIGQAIDMFRPRYREANFLSRHKELTFSSAAAF